MGNLKNFTRWKVKEEEEWFAINRFFLRKVSNERIVFSLRLILAFSIQILTIKIKEKLIFLMRSSSGKWIQRNFNAKYIISLNDCIARTKLLLGGTMHYENFYIIILFNAYIRYHKKFKINVTTFDYNDNITRWWRQKKKKKKERKKMFEIKIQVEIKFLTKIRFNPF